MTYARPLLVAAVLLLPAPAAAEAAGTLAPPQTYALSGAVTDVDAGDLTADGRLDVVAARPDAGAVDTLRQLAPALPEARPTFAVQPFLEGIGNAGAVATGDWDGDGDTDAVIEVSGVLRTYVNDGAGVFTRNAIEDRALNGSPRDIVVADVNDDDDPDLLLPETNGGFSWSAMLGQAGHGWGTRADYQSASEIPRGLAVADFSGDGLPDVAAHATMFGSGDLRVRIWLGSPDGNFTLGPALDSGSGDSRHSVAAGDMNHDGDPEIAVVAGARRIIWTGGAGDSFSGPAVVTLPNPTQSVALGDLDIDGDADLVTVDDGLQRVRVQLTGSGGAVGPATLYPTGPGADAIELQLEDFDGDGGLDVFTANDNASSTVLFNEVATNLGVTLDTLLPPLVTAGSTFTYRVTVMNFGPDAATDPVVTLELPEAVDVESVPAGCSRPTAADPFTCSRAGLGVLSSWELRFDVSPQGPPGTLSATASVASRERDPASANDSDTELTTVHTTDPADLGVSVVDEPDPVTVGGTVTYTISATNHGTAPARDVRVDNRPWPFGDDATSVLSAVPGKGACTVLAGFVSCEVGTLVAGETVAVVVRALALEGPLVQRLSSVVTTGAEAGGHPNLEISSTAVVPVDTTPPELTVSDVSLAEGDTGRTNAVFELELSEAPVATASVAYATADAEATEVGDYSGRAGTLTFQPGQTTRTIAVPVRGDLIDEEDETFSLQLDDALGIAVDDGTAIATITDDDAPPVITIEDLEMTEDAAAEPAFYVPVRLLRASGKTVRVRFVTAPGGNATPGVDYTPTSVDLTFPPGEQMQTLYVPVTEDTIAEPDETVGFALESPVNATIGSVGDGTIIDDDRPAGVGLGPRVVGVEDATVREGVPGAGPVIRVDAAAPEALRARFTIVMSFGHPEATDFEAEAWIDDLPAPGTARQVSARVLDDAIDEDVETFEIWISPLSGQFEAVKATIRVEDDDEQQPTVAALGDMRFNADGQFVVELSRPAEARRTVAVVSENATAPTAFGQPVTFSELRKTVASTSCRPALLRADPCGFESGGYRLHTGNFYPVQELDQVVRIDFTPVATSGPVSRPGVAPPRGLPFTVRRRPGAPRQVIFERGETRKVVPMTFNAPPVEPVDARVRFRIAGGACEEWANKCVTVPVEGPGRGFPAPPVPVQEVEGDSLRTSVQCPPENASCEGTVQIAPLPSRGRASGAATAMLGRASFRLRGGQRRALAVPLNRRARTLLRRRGKLAVTLVARMRADGKPMPAHRKRLVLRPTTKGKRAGSA